MREVLPEPLGPIRQSLSLYRTSSSAPRKRALSPRVREKSRSRSTSLPVREPSKLMGSYGFSSWGRSRSSSFSRRFSSSFALR